METKSLVLEFLIREPRFRERAARMRGIADLLIEKYRLDIDRRKLAEILKEGETMSRMWRQILQEREDLRGNDYGEDDGTKKLLEQGAMLELGYDPAYTMDIRSNKLFND